MYQLQYVIFQEYYCPYICYIVILNIKYYSYQRNSIQTLICEKQQNIFLNLGRLNTNKVLMVTKMTVTIQLSTV